ncbi:M16 family metallopeptidase [Sediminibacillus massiliensis]|uniref:M16 family metallopeptidase n=1 Tax=Sediminibacillus massiliensis TaxID=1926277 RepID=UPI00098852D1|nr:pitrilysin family protein [Sediminibacillus massiliensis]
MLRKHTCTNGLRIVMEDIPAVRSVTIGIWIRTGSRNETHSNNGISHFLEHMLFKGTANRTAKDIAEAFDAIGGQVNAFTSKEYTCFYAKVLDSHKELALEILADMFFHSAFDEEEMEKEKKVVLEEIKMAEDTPDDIVHDLLSHASYGKHPLGFPILGTEKTLASFTKETLQNYMDKQYTPKNVVVSIAGNVQEDFFNEVEKHFGSYQASDSNDKFEKPDFLAEHIERRKETEQAHLCLGYNGLSVEDDDIYSLIVMNNIFGGSMSSRLFQEVREERGLAYSVFSYHSSFLDNGLLTIYAGTGKDQLPLLRETIDKTINELIENGLTDKELKNSKEQLKGNLMLSLESTNSRMSRNGKNELILNRHRTLDEMIKEIDAVTHDSTDRIIQSLFNDRYASALISP